MDDMDELVVSEIDFFPEADVFSIWVSEKTRKSTRGGEPIVVTYWEGCWDIPQAARDASDTRKRPQITASSTASRADAEAKCRERVMEFWLNRAQGARLESALPGTSVMSREERRAAYTVESFLREYYASKTNPNTAPENRWSANNALRTLKLYERWIYPYLGSTRLTALTHEQVRIHFTETLPGVTDSAGQRMLGDRHIRNIYTAFRSGLHRAGAKGLVATGEFISIGIRMTFEGAGTSDDIDALMWDMNTLLQRPDVIADPLALRWALAYGQGLRRGERCGLQWSDIDLDAQTMKVQRQLSYVQGRGEFLDGRLKANEARTITITPITRPFLEAARARRDHAVGSGNWDPKPDLADLVLLRDDGTAHKLNDDSALFHAFMEKYQVDTRGLAPGSLRHAAATYWANYGGPDGRGVSRESLRKFLGHSPSSKLDAYYARSSQEAMSREFGSREAPSPTQPSSQRHLS